MKCKTNKVPIYKFSHKNREIKGLVKEELKERYSKVAQQKQMRKDLENFKFDSSSSSSSSDDSEQEIENFKNSVLIKERKVYLLNI